MKKLFFVWMLMMLGFTPAQVLAQPNSDVGVNVIPVAGSIYLLESYGSGNIGVSIGEDGVLMIDDKLAPLAGTIRQSLNTLSHGKLKFILNTHWHGDHTGGNEVFGLEGTIIAHDNVRKRLSTKQVIKLFNMVSEPHAKEALPVITFDQSLSIHFNGEEIKVIHLAKGHTDGDSIVFFTGANVVHMGDHFFNGMYPFVDLDSGGDVQGYMDNVAKVLTMVRQDARIIPGHGPLAGVDDLKDFHAMLVETTGIVKRAMNQGKSLEDIQKNGFSEDIVQKWEQGFLKTEQWIEIIYRSYL